MIAVVGSRRIWIGAQARLVDSSSSLQAWAERRVRSDPDIKWVLGNFVEADNPNSNGHLFPLPGLQSAIDTIRDKPLNMLHQANYVVGHYADAEFATLPDEDAVMEGQGAYVKPGSDIIEALAAFYHEVFPKEYAEVQKAHDEGSLFFSMEARSDTVTCPSTHGGCGSTYAFAGRRHPSYCAHLQADTPIQVDQPHFQAGALILPPVRPGWRRADITQLEAWMREHDEVAEALYAGLKAESPEAPEASLEGLMAEIIGLRDEVTGLRSIVGPMALERLAAKVGA
jgi:hypothetical protein